MCLVLDCNLFCQSSMQDSNIMMFVVTKKQTARKMNEKMQKILPHFIYLNVKRIEKENKCVYLIRQQALRSVLKMGQISITSFTNLPAIILTLFNLFLKNYCILFLSPNAPSAHLHLPNRSLCCPTVFSSQSYSRK